VQLPSLRAEANSVLDPIVIACVTQAAEVRPTHSAFFAAAVRAPHGRLQPVAAESGRVLVATLTLVGPPPAAAAAAAVKGAKKPAAAPAGKAEPVFEPQPGAFVGPEAEPLPQVEVATEQGCATFAGLRIAEPGQYTLAVRDRDQQLAAVEVMVTVSAVEPAAAV
jgi:hypothetical protein